MKYYAPAGTESFACIADRCKHNCCIGWEIDIDDDSLAYYQTVSGEIGDRLQKGISTDSGAHFVLDEEEHCPLLNKNGLCDLITALGKDSLCQICRDHPRYFNFFCDRTEYGAGLCCEAAVGLILNHTEPFALECVSDDGVSETADEEELAFFKERDALLNIAVDRSLSLKERYSALLDAAGITLPSLSGKEWAEFYKSLERLDTAWDERLKLLLNEPCDMPQEFEIPFEQLLAVFLFRHSGDNFGVWELCTAAAFAVHACDIISRLFLALPEQTMENLAEIVREYSAEIEYSEENLDAIFELLTDDRDADE